MPASSSIDRSSLVYQPKSIDCRPTLEMSPIFPHYKCPFVCLFEPVAASAGPGFFHGWPAGGFQPDGLGGLSASRIVTCLGSAPQSRDATEPCLYSEYPYPVPSSDPKTLRTAGKDFRERDQPGNGPRIL